MYANASNNTPSYTHVSSYVGMKSPPPKDSKKLIGPYLH